MSGAAQIKAMTAPLPRQHSNENGETNANSTDNNINSIKTNGGNAHSQQQHKDGKHGSGGGQEQPTTSLTIKNAGGTTSSRAITDLGAQSNSSRASIAIPCPVPNASTSSAAAVVSQSSSPQSQPNKRSGSTCSSSSTISSSIGQHQQAALAQRFFSALPPSGTPLDAQFHCLQAAGQMVHGHWHHFMAQATVGNDKEASVLLFDKKCNVKGPSRLGRMNRLGLSDLLRYDLSQLQQLVHPRILRLLHPLAENKEMLAFASEALQCTLDKLLFDQFAPEDGGAPLEKLEKKLGVLQLIEGLSYLHNNAKMLHGNLTPQAVYVTALQQWKIGGFEFSVAPKKPNQFPCFPWTKKLPACLQPDLDFLAPEYLNNGINCVTTAADVFSLGALICWIYADGRRLIDVKNNLESYQIVVDQLDVALELLNAELGQNLKASMVKVLSKEIDQRPAVQMLALNKHFDDPILGALRQLDDLAQEFDPANKAAFLGQTLCSFLPQIPEPLWFRRVLRRLNEHLLEAHELFPSLLRSLSHMLQHCESHNIHRLRPWFRRIIAKADDKMLSQALLDQMPIIFRRLSDEQVEDRCFDLLIQLLQGPDPHLKQNAVRALPQIVDFVPGWFVQKRLISVLQSQAAFFQEHIPRQIDLLVAIAHLSDRCDAPTLHYLLTVASVCSTLHPAIVHSKSRLVQRILTCDVSRLKDPLVIAHHLLNPLVLGLALPEMSPAHFDDVMSSSRILLDIIEQLRYESDDSRMKESNGNGRLCSRRVSMSSNHLPRLLITAARPSIGGDGRKMSFLSADGRLEDPGSRRESKDSRCSLESEISLRIYNGSDISDESALGSSMGGGGGGGGGQLPAGGGRQFRRKSWLEQGYMHSVSLEQQCSSGPTMANAGNIHPQMPFDVFRANSSIGVVTAGRAAGHHAQMPPLSTLVRKFPSPNHHRLATIGPIAQPRNCSPEAGAEHDRSSKPVRPNSFTNLGHNLACTLWKTFY